MYVDDLLSDEMMLQELQQDSFGYFLDQVNDKNGLVADKTQPGTPASIAVVGLALSCYIVAAERKFITREQAIAKTLATLRFFYNADQSEAKDATGYKGFYYHFLDMATGARMWESELSTIDTALFIIGAINSGSYFTGDNDEEKEIVDLADKLYKRIDWQWALNSGTTLSHGWKPETGFLNYHWNTGYSEAHLLYILALGSPTFPIGGEAYKEWISTFEWKNLYDVEHLYAGPLFIHQMSQIWLDLRKVQDDFNRKRGIDYFENSRRATCVQQKYAIDNPYKFEQYGKYCWGLSASDGPGPVVKSVNGKDMYFYNYTARGVNGPDDGTISPWAVVASLPFAPDIVIDTLHHIIERLRLLEKDEQGLHASYNATYPDKNTVNGWISPWQFGLNQGPVVLMIENYFTGMVWDITKKNQYIKHGMQKAGFTGGWLDNDIKTQTDEK